MITNITNKEICNKGNIALNMAFNTTCKLGTPDTKRKGRSTRNALNAFTSKPWMFIRDKTVDINLSKQSS